MTETGGPRETRGHEERRAERDFRSTLALLRSEAPPPHPVRVRRPAELEDNAQGDCRLVPGRKHTYFVISVSRWHPAEAQKDTLIHEWAHAHTWDEEKPHGPLWGVHYARLYSLVFD